MGQLVGELGGAVSGALIVLGDRLGLYRAMADGEPVTSEDLAKKTGCDERYLREWLSAQAAAGYLDYDPQTRTFSLSPEASVAFADEGHPAFFAGAFEVVQSLWIDEPKIEEAFRTGAGVGWHEHSTCLFRGTERFFRPGYNANLVSSWLPAIDGMTERLERGARVADVGCGHGASTILMAQAYPNSRFYGFDYHAPSIERARQSAQAAGVGDRITFQQAAASDFPAEGFDLVAMFDCLHDMGDPVGAARHVRSTLAPTGTWMVVEPQAGDRPEDNFNPVGRAYYAFSTLLCTPSSLSQEAGLALGTQAGPARLRAVVEQAGFGECRVAAGTPFNMVLEVRP